MRYKRTHKGKTGFEAAYGIGNYLIRTFTLNDSWEPKIKVLPISLSFHPKSIVDEIKIFLNYT